MYSYLHGGACMKKHLWIIELLTVFCLAGLVPALANAAEPDQQALSDLLNALDQKIKDADCLIH